MLIWLPLILVAICLTLYVDWGESYVVPRSAAQPAVTARPDDGAEGLATPPGQRPSAPRTDAEG